MRERIFDLVGSFALGMLFVVISVLGIPVIVLAIFRRRESSMSVWFALLCMCNVIWSLMNALEYLADSDVDAATFYNLKFVAVGFSCIFLFVVVVGFELQKTISKVTLCYLMVFPICTLAIALCDRFLNTRLLFKYFSYILENGIRVSETSMGVWFIAHCIFCYILMTITAIMLIRYFVRMPPRYRLSAGIILASMGVIFVLTVFATFRVLPYGIDAVPIAAVIANVFFYSMVFFPQSMGLLTFAREIVFEKANYPLLVLDHRQNIVDYNSYTKNLGESLGMETLTGVAYNTFFNEWLCQTEAVINKDNSSIFTIHKKHGDEHFQVVFNNIHDRSKKSNAVIGIHVEIINITPAMELVHKLQEDAYFDQLTGLQNRNSFIRISEEYDREKTFPLCVAVGDLNKLKLVNDSYGHTCGDLVLQQAASIMAAARLKNSTVFRIGGDEFVVLAPGASIDDMEVFIAEVQNRFEETQVPGIESKLSIALGCRAKKTPEESIHQVVSIADKEMYLAKYDRRGVSRNT